MGHWPWSCCPSHHSPRLLPWRCSLPENEQGAERTLLWAQREGITKLEGRRGPRGRKRVEKTTSWWGAEAAPTTSNAEQLETRRKPLIPKTGSRGVLGRKSPTPLAPTQKIQWGKSIPLNPLVAALSSLSHPTERRQIVVNVALGDLPVVIRWSSWQRRTCPCVVLSSVEKRRERVGSRPATFASNVTGWQRLGRIALTEYRLGNGKRVRASFRAR